MELLAIPRLLVGIQLIRHLYFPGIRPAPPLGINRHSACSSGEAEWWTVTVLTASVPGCVPLSRPQLTPGNVFFQLIPALQRQSQKQKRSIAGNWKRCSYIYRLPPPLLHFGFPLADIAYIARTATLVTCGFENETKQNLHGDALGRSLGA